MDQTLDKVNTPLVSIGIPVYNAEKFIVSTIKSVLAQTYTNFELIITDDGSTDNSVDKIKNFNDSRIKLIVDGKNKGISYRLNQQIQLAKGKYFFRMDADDLMFPQRVQRQLDFLEKNSQIDVVGSSAVIIDDENKIIGTRTTFIPENYKKALSTTVFIHPTVAGKKEWFSKYLYDESLIGVEDFDLWLRSYLGSNFHILQEPLLYYRDPLQFKLKTYLFRLRQQRKKYRQDLFLSNNPLEKFKILAKSYLKTNLSKVFSALGIESIYISKRNKELDKEKKNKLNDELESLLAVFSSENNN